MEFIIKNGVLKRYIAKGETTNAVIPDGVTEIGYGAFHGCTSLVSVTIPNSVIEIGTGAFICCTSLASVTIPDGVTKIGEGAFQGCKSLASVTIPDSVTKIRDQAFSGCKSLVSVTIPDGVTKIGEGAFQGCKSLASVTIPDSVTKIGRGAFSGCESLASVTIPDGVTKIGEGAFQGCKSLASVTIPDSVTKIRDQAFSGCESLASITIPSGMTSIGKRAFAGCVLKERSDGITYVDTWVVDCDVSTANAMILKGIRGIGNGAFEGCKRLTSVTIPDSVTSIDKWAFSWCESLTDITIPSSVTSIIGEGAFAHCDHLIGIAVDAGNKVYHSSGNCVMETASKTLIAGCANSTVPADGSVTSIGEGAFAFCTSLASVTIPDGVTEIGSRAFNGCESLVSVTIPDSVTEIGSGAFNGCASLASVTIPDGVTKIGDWAFDDCPNLTVVCKENSFVHRYCTKEHISYLFDYQYETFHGIVPQNFEMLESPFLADEERPYLFISYSHKDREAVLPVLKGLYESGWKVWYDEGLTIGDSYDEVLEKHVENCSVFLLFVTGNSLASRYIDEHEIPWAKQYGKPIIKCILEQGTDYEIYEAQILDTVDPGGIETALERVSGLTKGEKREARGITVAAVPSARNDRSGGDGFAYCLYAKESSSGAKTVMHSITEGGAILYDAGEEGANEEKLSESACLVIFLDNAFLADSHLANTLTEAYRAGKDVAVCLLEDIVLPAELKEFGRVQWLHYTGKVRADLDKKLIRHLEKRGCRNVSAIVGFDYEKTDAGIVITKCNVRAPHPRLEREYGGVPVVRIADHAFENCHFMTEFAVPDSVTAIGDGAINGERDTAEMPQNLQNKYENSLLMIA